MSKKRRKPITTYRSRTQKGQTTDRGAIDFRQRDGGVDAVYSACPEIGKSSVRNPKKKIRRQQRDFVPELIKKKDGAAERLSDGHSEDFSVESVSASVSDDRLPQQTQTEQVFFREDFRDEWRQSSYQKRMVQSEMRRRKRARREKRSDYKEISAEYRKADERSGESEFGEWGDSGSASEWESYQGRKKRESDRSRDKETGSERPDDKRETKKRERKRADRTRDLFGEHDRGRDLFGTKQRDGIGGEKKRPELDFHADTADGVNFHEDRNNKEKRNQTNRKKQSQAYRKTTDVKEPFRIVAAQTGGVIHGKIGETEEDNVAVHAAHQSEFLAERVVEKVQDWRYRGTGKKKKRASSAATGHREFGFSTGKGADKNASTSGGFRRGNEFSREHKKQSARQKKRMQQKRIQKNRIKRAYLLARRKGAAENTVKTFRRAENVTVLVAEKVQAFARRRLAALLPVALLFLLILMVMVGFSSCAAIFSGTSSMILAGTYLSESEEIDAAELLFTQLETDLQETIDGIETEYPGYDEYYYNIGEIGHNPFTLISYLSAKYEEFTISDVEEEIRELFAECYSLTVTPETEERTRVFPDPYGQGNDYIQYYEVEVLKTTLTVTPLETVVAARMDTEQTEQYEIYTETAGGLQMFESPLALDWYRYISSFYGYRINQETGVSELHRGLDLAVPVGTEVYAGNSGTVATGYDDHYGYYISITDEKGYVTKYAHLQSVDVTDGQKITKGDGIGRTGDSGSTAGSKLHIECMYDGNYYNPIFYFDTREGTLYGEPESPGGSTGSNVGDGVPPASYDDATVQLLFDEGNRYLGMPYTFGGTPPESFDCSAFVCWVFTNSHVKTIPRTTAQALYEMSEPVTVSEAQAGDLIFFTGTYNAGRPVTHVGLYCGNGVMLHCGDPIKYSSINTAYWQSHFFGFGRIPLE